MTRERAAAQQAMGEGARGKEEDLHNSDGREEKLESSRGDGEQRRAVFPGAENGYGCGGGEAMGWVWLDVSLATSEARVGGGRAVEWQWPDGLVVDMSSLGEIQGKRKGSLLELSVVSCLDLAWPARVVLCCAVLCYAVLCCAVACRSAGLGSLVPVRASPNPGSPPSLAK